ncbi:helix-turn-helix domain-containing protein [Nocardia vaccinii]|uniref:helix-turn-helix domain-containing protein n=1 Tax=Nocardia vaccinii TaxID=1822 RepID=UPI0008355DDF|nr:helix-turn-helix transcriptional regulator [Nocardia vaccinii]
MTIEATTVPRRLLARRLVELREAADLTRDAAAERAEIGRQTLWRLENGRTSEVKKPTIRALCRVYEVDDEDLNTLLWLADESRKDGWWQSYSDAIYLDRDLFMSLEGAASRIRSFQLTLIPGLAQTADYRRAMARDFLPVVSDKEFEQHLEVLNIRQGRLSDSKDPLTLEVLISEATLRHRIGGAAVMRSQVHYLYELSTLPNISVRIIPLTVEGHLGLQTGSFVLLEFPEHLNPSLTQPPVVFIESYAGALYLDKPAEIELYKNALAAIEAAALGEPQSRELLQQIEEEYAA